MKSRLDSLKRATIFWLFLHFITANSNHICWHFRDSTVALLSALPDNRRFVKLSLCKREGVGQKQTFHSDSELSHW